MDIFTTPIVPSSQNAWWQDLPASWNNLSAGKILMIATAETSKNYQDGLEKMVKACKVDPSNANIMILDDKERIAWNRLNTLLQPELVMLLGVDPSQLGIQSRLTPNALTSFDGCTWIVTAAPSIFFEDTTLRSHVWNNCLRRHFNIPS